MSPTDSALLRRWINRRDPEAFKELCTRYAPMIHATSTRILGNVSEAEDVTQECFERLSGMAENPTGHLGAWLHRVATNRAIDHIRTAKRRQAREDAYVAARDESTEIGWDDVYAYVDEAIATLPDKMREPLVAHYLEGQRQARIAETLGISRQAVGRRINKGVEAIRRALKRRGITVGAAALATMMGSNLAEAAPLPVSLEATLGKLSVAGVRASKTTATIGATAATIGGVLVMKKIAIIAAIIAAALGVWTLSADKAATPPPEAQTAGVTTTPPEIATANSAQFSETRGKPRAEGTPSENSMEAPPEETPSAGAVITGRVLDVETGQGVPRVNLLVQPINRGRGASAESDAEGRYRLEGLSEGAYEVGPSHAPGYPKYGIRSKWIQVELRQDQIIENVDFSFEPGVRVSGIVVSADGEPVAGARVGAMIAGMPGAEHATTKADGTFLLRLKMGGSDLLVQARNEAFESKALEPLVLPSEGLEGLVLMLTEEKSASISGTVVNPRGIPITGAHIHLSRGKADYIISSGRADTTDNGAFVVEHLAAGNYGIRLTPPEQSTWSELDEVMRVELAKGKHRSGLRLVLETDKGGLAIAGRVVDTQGKPIKDVEVRVALEQVRSDAQGAFMITGLDTGMHSLYARYVGSRDETRRYSHARVADVRADTLDVEIVLHGVGMIEGRVIHADTGESIEEFELFLSLSASTQFSPKLLINGKKVHHPEGAFSRESYVGGVTVTAKAPGFAPAFHSVEVRENETISGIELRLETVQALTGRVVNSRGEGVAGARLYFGRIPHMSGEDRFVGVTDKEGAFSIDGASSEIQHLSATHQDYAPEMVRIVEGTTIVLPDGGTIEGRVTKDGEPLGNVDVGVRYRDRRDLPWLGVRSKRNGAYEIPRLPSGAVEVYTGRDRRVSREAIVEANAVTKVDLDFSPATAGVYGRIHVGELTPQRTRVEFGIEGANGFESGQMDAEADGSYNMEDMPSGLVRLSANLQLPDGSSRRQFVEVELQENERIQQDLDFTVSGEITGRFLGFHDGFRGVATILAGEIPLGEEQEYKAFFSRLYNEYGARIVMQAACEEDGAFLAEGLTSGLYTVVALVAPKEADESLEGIRWATSTVELAEGKSAQLDFDFR
jgi:RNA polymerase sigma factor (sigma-70 family)